MLRIDVKVLELLSSLELGLEQSLVEVKSYCFETLNLTPADINVSLGDVNKICFDDYAHTVH